MAVTYKACLDTVGVAGVLLAAGIAAWAVLDSRLSAKNEFTAMVGQQKVMADQLSEMQAEQRPWVAGIRITNTALAPHREMKIAVTITNSGHSPAFALRGYYVAKIENTEASTMPPLPECTSCSTAALLSSASRTYAPTISAPDLSNGEVARLKSGTDTIVVAGRLDYQDGAGKSHHTYSCAIYSNVTHGFIGCSKPDTLD